jgi:hypothetical protein
LTLTFAKAQVVDNPRQILENSDPVAEAQLRGWQGTETFER